MPLQQFGFEPLRTAGGRWAYLYRRALHHTSARPLPRRRSLGTLARGETREITKTKGEGQTEMWLAWYPIIGVIAFATAKRRGLPVRGAFGLALFWPWDLALLLAEHERTASDRFASLRDYNGV
jgi:hypothetical protein